MTFNSKCIFIAATLVVVAWLSGLFAASHVKTHYFESTAIEHGCGQYNSTTSLFEWKNK